MADNRDNDQLLAYVVNNLAPIVRPVEVNERDILMGEYMMPPIVENWSNIIYLSYGYDNFQLRPDVMNLFLNNFPFYGRTDTNLHYHISHFDEYCRNFKYHGVNEEALKMRLFPHTLNDKAREWLDSLPPRTSLLRQI
ncbi:Retrotrans gag domain-containing protein [Abeliophyllum distichum]|uniref:Retrotrans gag domain-containing protein n=1 Tax=Abeliophyllum distichum TaxID=126358 RepID=A0ABD1RT18_9LAMI